MSIEKKVEATAKNLQGKAQEALGNLTGDPADKAEGKVKQAEAQVNHTVENIREPEDKDMENAKNRAGATGKNIEGKVQEFVGDVTGDPQTKVEGQGKQVEAKVRHAVENIKE